MVYVISLFISLDINRVRGGVCSSFFDVFSEEESCGVGYYSKNQITKKRHLENARYASKQDAG